MAMGAKPLRDLVDLVGIEPTTSSMPFLIFDCTGATPRKLECDGGAVFMRVCPLFPALTCTRATPRKLLRYWQGCEGYDTSHDTATHAALGD
jgi:hypothetical protein